MRRTVLLAAGLAFLVAAIALVAWTLMPDYLVRDYDPALMAIARTADPIRAALDRHVQRHGRLPADAAGLEGLPQTIRAAGSRFVVEGRPAAWHYFGNDQGTGFTLSYKLGWDPRLILHKGPEGTFWEYDPGDGSDPTRLRLYP